MMKNISVIIPIYNAEKYLSFLFEALDANDFIGGDEILLIDNGSSDLSMLLCQEKVNELPSLYKLFQYKDKAGSYAARNFGVQQAKGEILVFTDSDTKPVTRWVDTIRNELSYGMVIAGKIQLEIENNGLWEHFDNIAHLNSEANALTNRVATANMAVHRSDYFKVGLFEERYSGGDYEWSTRAYAAGLRIVFNDQVMVYHPTRKSFKQILTKERRIAYGTGNHYRLQNKSYVTLVMIFLLKIFKFDTNYRYLSNLKKVGMNKSQLKEFNCSFMKIRIEQLKYAIAGFKMIDVRKLGIK
ncbi:glycosyltransferase family 2 protein [Holdemania massiliensis]|uniref:glycosyltransferase family 2 protein n=1 Tax=Holdemania massiliensis TaxID=1468449 RepID=UPI003522E5C7